MMIALGSWRKKCTDRHGVFGTSLNNGGMVSRELEVLCTDDGSILKMGIQDALGKCINLQFNTVVSYKPIDKPFICRALDFGYIPRVGLLYYKGYYYSLVGHKLVSMEFRRFKGLYILTHSTLVGLLVDTVVRIHKSDFIPVIGIDVMGTTDIGTFSRWAVFM